MDEFHSSQKSCVSAVNQQRRKLRDFQESLKRYGNPLLFYCIFTTFLLWLYISTCSGHSLDIYHHYFSLSFHAYRQIRRHYALICSFARGKQIFGAYMEEFTPNSGWKIIFGKTQNVLESVFHRRSMNQTYLFWGVITCSSAEVHFSTKKTERIKFYRNSGYSRMSKICPS